MNLDFEGILHVNGEPTDVHGVTEVWQSGKNDLPVELTSTAKEKVLYALNAHTKYGKTLVQLVDELNRGQHGVLRIFACSPPICWNPQKTSLFKR
jgi:hypothetical protein